MSFTLETSKTGKDAIVFNKHKYRESYTIKNGDIVWKCLGRNCKASITTNSDKTAIYSSKDCHTGSHPVTLRTMTPTSPQHRRNHLVTPSQEVDGASTPQASCDTPVSLRSVINQSPTEKEAAQTIYDIQAENQALKKELQQLRDERKAILDHSIESDQRLLKYTEEVFPNPNVETVASESLTTFNIETQTDGLFYKNELDQAYDRINHLQLQIEVLSRPCERCVILREESGNMINSIRCLEAEIQALKQIQSDTQNIITLPIKKVPTLALQNSFGLLNEEDDLYVDDNEGFTTVSKKRGKNVQKSRPKATHNFRNVSNTGQIYSSEPRRAIHTPFNEVTVIGDSHVRNLAQLLGNKVTENTSVSGICKPGAGVLSMKPTVEPPRGHCYVLMAGTNDVGAGREEDILDHLEEVLLTCKKSSSVLLIPLTTRYDHPPGSHIHRTVNKVNSFMADLCRRHDNVELVDIKTIGRRHHTSHGLHLRSSGKRLLANLIASRLATSHAVRSREPREDANHQLLSYAAAVSRNTPSIASREVHQSPIVSNSSNCKYFLREEKTVDHVI